jgi:hypothetical protein
MTGYPIGIKVRHVMKPIEFQMNSITNSVAAKQVIVRIIKEIRVRYFHTRFSKFDRFRYAHAGARPNLPHTVCFAARMPYIRDCTWHIILTEGLKSPICNSGLPR